MQKFKSNDRIVLKKDMDRPLDKTESIYRVVNFYKSRDGEYYYEMELAEPASDYLNNMALNQEYVEKTTSIWMKCIGILRKKILKVAGSNMMIAGIHTRK